MIEVKNVVKTFDGFAALNDATLSVPTGAVYGLVGPNGAGKSTIIRHLTGIFRQDSGTVRLGGEDVWENAALKAKLKVLVEKVEEYRATEDSMRATLLTAQRMADSIVKEAEQKRDQMMTQAEIDAKLKINCLKNEAAAAEERLRKGKEELEKFSAAVRAVCDKEIQLLNELPQAPVELPQEEAKPEDSVQEIEDSVMAAFSEAAPEEDGDAAETQTEASEPVAEAADSAADTSDPFGDFPDLSSTRQINLDELKFGRNYNT